MFDSLLRKKSWTILERKKIRVLYIQAINDIYDEAKTAIRTYEGQVV